MLPSVVVTSVRAGQDAFVQLQRLRMSPFEPSVQHYSRRAASEQSYSRLDAPLGDDRDVDTEILWNLVNRVLAILEAGADGTDASQAFGTWYRTYFTNVDELHRIRDQLAKELPEVDQTMFDGLWSEALLATIRTFLTGQMDITAGLVATLLDSLRARGYAFTPEDESCFSDIMRLMTVPVRSPSQFLQWQAAASRLVTDARYILSAENSQESHSSPVNQVRALALDMLIMMSGDITLVLDSCNNTGVDALGFACALCSITHAFIPLDEVHRLYKTSCAQVTTPDAHWAGAAIAAILGCTTTTDMIYAMTVVAENVDKHSSQQDDEGAADMRMKRFCMLYMAAHVADLCLPSILPLPPATSLLFERNALIQLYVEEFSESSQLWSSALMYYALSPLLNPKVIESYLINHVTRFCSADSGTHRKYVQLYRSALEGNGPLQQEMRQTLRAIVDGNEKSLNTWLQALDDSTQYANFFVHEAVIEANWSAGRHADAVWEAIATHQTGLMERHLKQCLSDVDVLTSSSSSIVVSHVGEAVQNGLIPLGACPNGALSTLLRLTSAMVDVLEGPTDILAAPPRYRSQCSTLQRLGSTEYIMNHGLNYLHTCVVMHLMNGSMLMIDREFNGRQGNRNTVAHLVLLNTVVNKLYLRSKSISNRSRLEGSDLPSKLQALRIDVLTRVAAGR